MRTVVELARAAFCGGATLTHRLAPLSALGWDYLFAVAFVLLERRDRFGFRGFSLGCLLGLRLVTLLSHASESWESGCSAAWTILYLCRLATPRATSARPSFVFMGSCKGKCGDYTAEDVPDEGSGFRCRGATGLAFADSESGRQC